MKYTDKLGLPIWNKPETDVFDIEQFNEGMQAVDDTIIHILNQINDLAIGDTKVDLNEYVKEEVLKEYDKRIANKADKEEVETINSQMDNIVVQIEDAVKIGSKTITVVGEKIINRSKKLILNGISDLDIDFAFTKLLLPENNNFYGLELINCKNIKIKNLYIKETNVNKNNLSKMQGINIDNSSNIVLENGRLYGTRGLYVRGATGLNKNITIKDCSIEYAGEFGIVTNNVDTVIIDNCITCYSWFDCIKVNNNSKNVTINNCTSNYNGRSRRDLNDSSLNGNGIDTYSGGSRLIINNIRANNNSGAGIYMKTGTDNTEESPTDKTEISNIFAENNDGYAIDFSRTVADSATSEPYFEYASINNLFSQNNKGGIYIRGNYININNVKSLSNSEHSINIANGNYININNLISKGNILNAIFISKGEYINASNIQSYSDKQCIQVVCDNVDNVIFSSIIGKDFTGSEKGVLQLTNPINKNILIKDAIIFNSYTNQYGSSGSTFIIDGITYVKKSTLENRGSLEKVNKTFKAIRGVKADGIQTTFNFAHNLGDNPTFAFAIPNKANSTGEYFVTTDSKNVIVTYKTPPSAQTLSLYIYAEL